MWINETSLQRQAIPSRKLPVIVSTAEYDEEPGAPQVDNYRVDELANGTHVAATLIGTGKSQELNFKAQALAQRLLTPSAESSGHQDETGPFSSRGSQNPSSSTATARHLPFLESEGFLIGHL